MEYNRIISVTGMSGLFELVGSKADGAIVRALDGGATKFVSSRVHNFSHLESIEVYTINDNVNLAEVFKAMETSSETLPDDKDLNAVQSYLEKVYPTMDFERVYASDKKKMIKWFKIIKASDVKIPSGEEETSEDA